jgi:hypothetical protein
LLARGVSRLLCGAIATGELKPASSEFGQKATPLQLRNHFSQLAASRVAQRQVGSYLPKGQGIAGLPQEGKEDFFREFLVLKHVRQEAL